MPLDHNLPVFKRFVGPVNTDDLQKLFPEWKEIIKVGTEKMLEVIHVKEEAEKEPCDRSYRPYEIPTGVGYWLAQTAVAVITII